jgi:hypothetical protein
MRLIDANEALKLFEERFGNFFTPFVYNALYDVICDVETIDIDELTDKDRWISVTDGLPERHKTPCPRGNNPDFSNVSETVWICTQEGYTMEGTLEGDSWFDDMGQCLSDYFEDMAGHHVTHWMPLPKPPKGDVE